MDLRFNDEQLMIRDSVRDFLANECSRKLLDAIDADPRGHLPSVWDAMAGLGWTGLCVPDAFGGSALGFRELCIVIEESGRAAFPSPYASTMISGALALAHFGSDDQRRALLPAIVRGQCIVTFAQAGPDEPWELTRPGVRADSNGSGQLLHGCSLFVPFAQVADLLLVLARDGGEGRDGLTLYLIDAQRDGIACEPVSTAGLERQCRVRFDGCRVTAADVLGAPGKAWPVLRAIDDWAVTARCAQLIGGAQRVLEMSVEYARERKAFGRPIGSFQAIQHHCANMASAVLGARLVTDEAICRVDRGEPDASEHVAVAKAWTGESCRTVCSLGHQVHGAIGFTQEHDLQRYFRQAFAADLAHGDSLFHLGRVATALGL